MARFTDLSITAKFTIILTLCMSGLFTFAAYYSYHRQQALLIKGEVDNARIIARQIIEAREYMAEAITDEASRNYNLIPQVVATRIAQRITKSTAYYVRQTSLRFRNPENRPDPYEEEKLRQFSSGSATEFYGIVVGPKGEELRYLLPMKVEKSCLECHGRYESAPLFVRQRFPAGHPSYNYRIGEVIGAVSVSIPLAGLYRDMSVDLRHGILARGGMFLIVLILMGYLIHRVIIAPLTLVAASIARVTRTGNFRERIPERGQDEIGMLIVSFNDMMVELENKTLQSREAESRYRNFIRMARSAVVTFMDDGKIVITNDKAERLFGRSRQELLGEDFYQFIVNGNALRDKVRARVTAGIEGAIVETREHRVRNAAGEERPFEIVLSATTTDGSPMITAILRDLAGKR